MSAASAVERLSVSPIGTISPTYPYWGVAARERRSGSQDWR